MPQESRENDKKILIEILTKLENRLREIVYEYARADIQKPLFRRELMQLLPGPWEEVAAHFRRSREMLEKMKSIGDT